MPGGRPRVFVKRTNVEFPAPTPVPEGTLCRLWQGAIDKDGYGVLTDNKPTVIKSGKTYPHRKRRAHRWVWEMANGPIPEGLVVRHRCDNRLCFRLSHLELGTVAENNADTAKRKHAGPTLSWSPSELEVILKFRSLGWTWDRIHREQFPDRAVSTLKRIGKRVMENAAAGIDLWEIPPPPEAKYAAWREKGPR